MQFILVRYFCSAYCPASVNHREVDCGETAGDQHSSHVVGAAGTEVDLVFFEGVLFVQLLFILLHEGEQHIHGGRIFTLLHVHSGPPSKTTK